MYFGRKGSQKRLLSQRSAVFGIKHCDMPYHSTGCLNERPVFQGGAFHICYGTCMITALTHTTAVQYWRSLESKQPSVFMRSEGEAAARQLLVQRSHPRNEQGKQLSQAFPQIDAPYELLVSRGAPNPQGGIVKYRGYAVELPKNALVSLGQNIAVASPEFSFVQYASYVNEFIQIILFGFELCGMYRFFSTDRTFAYNLKPVVSSAELISFLENAPRMCGVRQARKAAVFVRDNSGSYMETALTLLWSLPGKHGGRGLSFPELNYRIERPLGRPDSHGRSFYKCDLCWPDKKVCVEYDSDEHHGSTDQMAEDSEKRIALTEMGYTVLEMTRQQVMNWTAFESFTNVLMEALGEHPRIRVEDYEAKRQKLWWRLLKSYSTYC